jgi:hypothetical protein
MSPAGPGTEIDCAGEGKHQFSHPTDRPVGGVKILIHIDNYIYHLLQHSTIIHSAQIVYLCVAYDSQNKKECFRKLH